MHSSTLCGLSSLLMPHCPPAQYFTVPHLFLQKYGHSSGIHRNSTGIRMESSRLRLKYSLFKSVSQAVQIYTFFSGQWMLVGDHSQVVGGGRCHGQTM